MTNLHLVKRPRRLRQSEPIRSLVRETTLNAEDLIYPLFVCSGKGVSREVSSMPGVCNFSVDMLVRVAEEAIDAGVSAVILFGLPETKDETGSDAYSESGVVQQAIRAVKKEFPELVVIADNCLCEYTDHGHCGVIKDRDVENDATLTLLAKTAVEQARAGADIIAPSNMMDGFVAAIRQALDENGFERIPIMSYAVKYASGFYGPFREAAGSTPRLGDRRSYQMDPPNIREALKEAELDVEQGADVLMVKPALPYLDVIRAVKERFDLPVAAYQVSGEYAMIKAAARLGWLDEDRVVMETLTSIKRAGAKMILTYFAKQVASRLRKRS